MSTYIREVPGSNLSRCIHIFSYVPVSSIGNILLAEKAAEAAWVPPKTVSVEVDLPLKHVTFPPHLVSAVVVKLEKKNRFAPLFR